MYYQSVNIAQHTYLVAVSLISTNKLGRRFDDQLLRDEGRNRLTGGGLLAAEPHHGADLVGLQVRHQVLVDHGVVLLGEVEALVAEFAGLLAYTWV